MGGTLALLLAERRPVYRAVPIAAALRGGTVGSLAPFFRWIKPIIPNPGKIRRRRSPPPTRAFCTRTKRATTAFPLRSMGDLNVCAPWPGGTWGRSTCPMLVVRGGMDQTVHPKERRMDHGPRGQRRTWLLLPASPRLHLGKERALLFERVIEFLTGRPTAQTHGGKTFSSCRPRRRTGNAGRRACTRPLQTSSYIRRSINP